MAVTTSSAEHAEPAERATLANSAVSALIVGNLDNLL
jgi:hypothetical protein